MPNPIVLIVAGAIAASAFAEQPATPPADAAGEIIFAPPAEGDPAMDRPEFRPPHPPHGRAFDGDGERGPRAGMGHGHRRGGHGARTHALGGALKQLSDDETPAHLRLTEEQIARLDALKEEMRERRESLREQAREFREGVREQRPAPGEGPLAQLKEILTPEQQDFIKAQLEERRAERQADAPRGPRGQRGPRGPRLSPEQAETVQMFNELSPEAQARIKAYIEAELKIQQMP